MRYLLICITAISVCGTCCELQATDAELPPKVQKIIDKHAAEVAEAEQEYREAMDKIKKSTIKNLERQMKTDDLEVALAVKMKIEEIKGQEALDLFGETIEAKPKSKEKEGLLTRIANGQPFRKEGMQERYVIEGQFVKYYRGESAVPSSKGGVTPADEVIKLIFGKNNSVSITEEPKGQLILTRTNGKVFQIELIENEETKP